MKFPSLLVIFCLLTGIVKAGETPDSIKADWAIKSPEEATTMALEYLGFLEMESFSIDKNFDTAMIFNINDDKTPFLHTEINGKDIWYIKFKDIDFNLDTSLGQLTTKIYDLSVLIDPKSGNLLKIYSPTKIADLNILPEPSPEYAEKHMGTERFYGFVNKMPDIDFCELIKILSNLFSLSKEFSASLVLYNRNALEWDEPRLVWLITFRGLPPHNYKARSGEGVPIYYRNYRRYAIDATTGSMLFDTSIPPVEPINGQN